MKAREALSHADDASATLGACAEPGPVRAKSTVGRPRRLTDRQVEWLLREYADYQAWKALRTNVRSQRQIAQILRVSAATVSLAIRSGGQYKQPSPEERLNTRKIRAGRLAILRRRRLL